jgi:hypothetical protein
MIQKGKKEGIKKLFCLLSLIGHVQTVVVENSDYGSLILGIYSNLPRSKVKKWVSFILHFYSIHLKTENLYAV